MFRALLREQEDLAWAPDPFAVLEMAVVRCATLAPGDRVEELLARIDALERRLAGGASEEPGGGAAPARKPPARGGAAPRRGPGAHDAAPGPATEAAGPEPAPAANVELPPAASVELPPAASVELPPAARDERPPAARPDLEPPVPEPRLASEPEPELDAEPEASPAASLEAVFDRLRAFAQEANRGLFAALEGGRLAARTEQTLRIALPSALAVRRLEARRDELAAVCERFFGRATGVALEVDGAAPAAAPRAAGPDPLEKRRRQEALDHPAVNQALEILQGEIVEIRPLGEH
jgi:DNA polymerase-3 subunit gamma/tau